MASVSNYALVGVVQQCHQELSTVAHCVLKVMFNAFLKREHDTYCQVITVGDGVGFS